MLMLIAGELKHETSPCRAECKHRQLLWLHSFSSGFLGCFFFFFFDTQSMYRNVSEIQTPNSRQAATSPVGYINVGLFKLRAP